MDRLPLFPDTTRIENDSLRIAGHDLTALADLYGTPIYIYDRATLDNSVTAYQSTLKNYYPAPSRLTYAGKAFLCKAIAEWTQAHRLLVDCTGEGEIGIAVAGSVPREHLLVHGVNKSMADLKSAMQIAATLVVDNLTELDRIANLFSNSRSAASRFPSLWLRLLPEFAVQTHHPHTETGGHDSKFGMARAEIIEAAGICKEKKLPLQGLHFHQDSNFRDLSPLIPAIELGLSLDPELEFSDEWLFCPGAGFRCARDVK